MAGPTNNLSPPTRWRYTRHRRTREESGYKVTGATTATSTSGHLGAGPRHAQATRGTNTNGNRSDLVGWYRATDIGNKIQCYRGLALLELSSLGKVGTSRRCPRRPSLANLRMNPGHGESPAASPAVARTGKTPDRAAKGNLPEAGTATSVGRDSTMRGLPVRLGALERSS